jgi:hypothetical protein
MPFPAPMAAWLRRIDLDLASDMSDADKRRLIERAIAQIDRNTARLEQWAREPGDAPNPLGEGVTLFDLNTAAHDLQARMDRIGAPERTAS